jgi:dihydrofolate reductase
MTTRDDLCLIAAVSENNVIGRQGNLPWHLSADLKRFRSLTTGHAIIMGRKTFEAIGRLLPDRITVIVTRQRDFHVDGAIVAHSIEQAIELTLHDLTPFVTGGAEVYRQALPYISKIHLTRVHTALPGDAYFPLIDWPNWRLVESQRFAADGRNSFDYSFETYLSSKTRISDYHR